LRKAHTCLYKVSQLTVHIRGLWFDGKCLWKTHIKHVETKCKKVINVMRAMAGHEWGADKQSLLDIYRAIIRSSIDYGCLVYGAAAKSTLEILDRIQNRALRLSTGAIKSTPNIALLVETDELPLSLRRAKLAMAYWVKLKGSGEELPATKVLDECWEYTQNKGKGFGWSIGALANEVGLNRYEYGPNVTWGNVPPWIFPANNVDLTLVERREKWVGKNCDIGQQTQEYINNTFYNYLQIYTDGSKDNGNGHVGAGVFITEFNRVICKRIDDRQSVFTAEIVAIILGLQWVEEVRPERVYYIQDCLRKLEYCDKVLYFL